MLPAYARNRYNRLINFLTMIRKLTDSKHIKVVKRKALTLSRSALCAHAMSCEVTFSTEIKVKLKACGPLNEIKREGNVRECMRVSALE